jgi:hypothetical protein
MALIDPDNPAVKQSAESVRDDYYKNLIINREAVQKAILALTLDPRKSYTFDSGQNTVTVSRQDLGSLRQMLQTLTELINDAQMSGGVSGQLVQVTPSW